MLTNLIYNTRVVILPRCLPPLKEAGNSVTARSGGASYNTFKTGVMSAFRRRRRVGVATIAEAVYLAIERHGYAAFRLPQSVCESSWLACAVCFRQGVAEFTEAGGADTAHANPIGSVHRVQHMWSTADNCWFAAMAFFLSRIAPSLCRRLSRQRSSGHHMFCRSRTQQGRAFLDAYAVYRHFRAAGWTVKPAMYRGFSFALYRSEPTRCHAEYFVLIAGSDDAGLLWRDVQLAVRIAGQVRKDIIICSVASPRRAGSRGGNTTHAHVRPAEGCKCIVDEVAVRRWGPRNMNEYTTRPWPCSPHFTGKARCKQRVHTAQAMHMPAVVSADRVTDRTESTGVASQGTHNGAPGLFPYNKRGHNNIMCRLLSPNANIAYRSDMACCALHLEIQLDVAQ